MRFKSKWAVVVTIFAMVGLCAITVQAFYSYTKRTSVREAQQIGLPEASNGIRHAFAAAEAYAILRAAYLPAHVAEKAVIKLGYLNEYVEHFTKRNKDRTSEVYKDLYNNLSGITAAQWFETCTTDVSPPSRLETIKELAKQRTLRFLSSDDRLPALPGGADYRAAIAKFRTDKTAIKRGVRQELETRGAACGRTA